MSDNDSPHIVGRITFGNEKAPIDLVSASVVDVLHEELTRLRAEVEEMHALLPGQYYMDPPDGGDVSVVEQFRRMAKDAERYRLARSKVAIIGNGLGAEFRIINLSPTYVAPNAGAEFDAAIDAARAALSRDT